MTEHAKIKASLEATLRALIARAEAIDDDLSEPNDDDWVENASESEGDEVMEKLGNIALTEIRHIKLALAQIQAGTYGICMHCRKPIAKARMEALPHATRCVKCTDR